MSLIERDSFNHPKVICFGEALMDRLGPLGGNPALDQPVQDCLGGAPANAACAMAKLGVDVAFVGCLGDDQIGQTFRQLMEEQGINISCLQIDQHLPSRTVLVKRDDKGERSFAGFYGDKGKGFADSAIRLNDLVKNFSSLTSQVAWLLVGTIPLSTKASAESLLWILEYASNSGIKIALDINWRPIFWNEEFDPNQGPDQFALNSVQPLLNKASLIKLSKEEAKWFFNSFDPVVISDSLSNKPDVVVTDGAKPLRWLIGGLNGTFDVPNVPLIVDTTGAGDSFTAGLICQMMRFESLDKNDENLKKMLAFSSACGAIVCSGSGAIDPQPTYEEVERFLSLEFGGIN
tara:strand:- start:3791 stop:4831 length:1041 start_codon:yes stop_codon:yes gene_type:complete